jgi:hypothetical protein
MEDKGLSKRHIKQIIRRNMIQKNHGDKTKYGKKDRRKNKLAGVFRYV